MKTAVVVSQITYLPDRYQSLLENIFSTHKKHVAGIVIIQNYSVDLFFKISWLYAIGCFRIASVLLKNVLSSRVTRVEKMANQLGIPVLKVDSVNTKHFADWLVEQQIECLVNVRTRIIYESRVLQVPKYGCYNIHHGLLPKYRGMYCDLYALAEKRPVGITLHRMNNKIDDGEIIFQEVVSKKNEINYMEYLRTTGVYEAKVINKLINYLIKHRKAPVGRLNRDDQIVYTRTPSSSQLIKMQAMGLRL